MTSPMHLEGSAPEPSPEPAPPVKRPSLPKEILSFTLAFVLAGIVVTVAAPPTRRCGGTTRSSVIERESRQAEIDRAIVEAGGR